MHTHSHSSQSWCNKRLVKLIYARARAEYIPKNKSVSHVCCPPQLLTVLLDLIRMCLFPFNLSPGAHSLSHIVRWILIRVISLIRPCVYNVAGCAPSLAAALSFSHVIYLACVMNMLFIKNRDLHYDRVVMMSYRGILFHKNTMAHH